MADESCCDHHDAKRLIGLKACDMINIKLGKSGGIYDALKIISLAEKAKMKIEIHVYPTLVFLTVAITTKIIKKKKNELK